MKTREQMLAHIADLIEQHGWASMHVGASEEFPNFTYTIGFSDLNHPEIILTGLAPAVAQGILSGIYHEIKEQGVTFKDGDTVEKLANLPIHFLQVSEANKRNTCFLTHDHYGYWNFSVLQMIWPDAEGNFPWNEHYETRLIPVQPLLNE